LGELGPSPGRGSKMIGNPTMQYPVREETPIAHGRMRGGHCEGQHILSGLLQQLSVMSTNAGIGTPQKRLPLGIETCQQTLELLEIQWFVGIGRQRDRLPRRNDLAAREAR